LTLLKLVAGPTWRKMLIAALIVGFMVPLMTEATAASASSSGGIATFAEPAGAPPNYIFPMLPPAVCIVDNQQQFQYLMYRPLYWYGGQGNLKLNPNLSLADPPVYNSTDTTVTVQLKSWRWSDGVPITASDIIFWMDMLVANKDNWCAYVPGGFPDNVTSYQAVGTNTVVFHLNASYNPDWFTANELTQIIPAPQQAWDRTSLSKPVGDYASTPAGAVAVYNFLNGQSADPGAFASNPLWQVVDGPWRLAEMTNLGFAKFVPNRDYSGSPKPRLSAFEEIPFTSTTAEFLALRSGRVDYGYLPINDLSEKSAVTRNGYSTSSWLQFGINYFPENFNNPTVGPMFRQLYIRQAMASLINEPEFIRRIYHGFAVPDYGPVPTDVPNDYATSQDKTNPYPYDPNHAKSLLKDNGWTVRPNGTSTCARPGTGTGECGAGIKAGADLSFNLQYAAGNPPLISEMEALKSAFGEAGITLNLSSAPLNTVFATAVPCTPSQAACSWEMANWGYGWIFTPTSYPSGEELFETGATTNAGSYSDPVNDQNTNRSLTEGLSALYTYENYLVKQLPVIWLPLPVYQISEVAHDLRGISPQDPFDQIYPENWYFSKS